MQACPVCAVRFRDEAERQEHHRARSDCQWISCSLCASQFFRRDKAAHWASGCSRPPRPPAEEKEEKEEDSAGREEEDLLFPRATLRQLELLEQRLRADVRRTGTATARIAVVHRPGAPVSRLLLRLGRLFRSTGAAPSADVACVACESLPRGGEALLPSSVRERGAALALLDAGRAEGRADARLIANVPLVVVTSASNLLPVQQLLPEVPAFIELPLGDYSESELVAVLTHMAGCQGLRVEGDPTEAVRQAMQTCAPDRGNDLLAGALLERARGRQAERGGGGDVITLADLRPPAPAAPPSVEAVLAELDALVGQREVKEWVRTLHARLTVAQQREQAGLPSSVEPEHLLFLGAPGTGKTTVARILGRVLNAMGVLRGGQLVEVDRASLVAGYSGQTAIQTREVLTGAMGGVCFVDEAYSLCAAENDAFGHEALTTLLKVAEDYRGEIVIILAGYEAEMQGLLDANPGMRSRFPTTLAFRDYDGEELLEIALRLLAKGEYVLPPGEEARRALRERVERGARAGGNGRAVRNVVAEVLAAQARRLSSGSSRSGSGSSRSGSRSREELQALQLSDLLDPLLE